MMRQFRHPNYIGELKCPICNTNMDAPVVLVGIPGTEKDGIVEAMVIHSECYQLWNKMRGINIDLEPLPPEEEGV